MKEFVFNSLIQEEDLCNRTREKDDLLKFALTNQKKVIYAPRKHGKTSIIKEIIPLKFENKAKKPFIFYVDLMSVNSEREIATRLEIALDKSQKKYNKFDATAKEIFDAFRKIKFDVGAAMGLESVEIGVSQSDPSYNEYAKVDKVFSKLKSLHGKVDLMIVVDEFQDLARFPGMLGFIRGYLQQFQKASIFYLGSRLKLIKDLFSHAGEFYEMADSYTFERIDGKEWRSYFHERFPVGTTIDLDAMIYLQEICQDVPVAINKIGAYIKNNFTGSISKEVIPTIVESYIEEKRGDFAVQIDLLSDIQRDILNFISSKGFHKRITTEMISETGISRSAIKDNVEVLEEKKILEYIEDQGMRVSNPLLSLYFRLFF